MKPTHLAVLAAALALPNLAAAPAAPRATVAQGPLTGVMDDGAAAFLGIPYAAPPVGALRWAPPKAPSSWGSTPRAAFRFGASCPQALAPPGGRAQWTTEYMTPPEPGLSEDCLFLNVWTAADMTGPRPAATRPVLLFIHGGANTEGSGAVPVYNGANLAKQGIVVVNINYRLSALGFLAHPELSAENGGASGNWAIQDQIAALQWVRANIAAFGGDPAKVTIAGQSAGGSNINVLLVSPLARGLFHRAIIESGGAGANPGALSTAEAAGVATVTGWGARSITEARALPVDKVPGRGGSVADGKVVPKSPSPPPMASDVPVMIGYNLNESAPLSRTVAAWRAEAQDRYGAQAEQFLRFYPGATDVQASDSAMREVSARGGMTTIANWVSRRTGGTQPVYAYFFTHVEPGPQSAQYGAFHTSEIPYFYDNLGRSPGRSFTDLDRRVSQQASSYLVNFVKTGNPNGAGLPQWMAMTPQNKAVLEIGDTVRASRLYPEGADDIIAAGRAPGARGPAAAPAAPAGGRGG